MELIEGENNFFEKAFSPNIVRFCFLQAHYRSVLDISNEAMVASEKGYNRLMEAISLIKDLKPSSDSSFDVNAWQQSCYDAMNDDFNTPILIAQLFEITRIINLVNDGKETLTTDDINIVSKTINDFAFNILGLKNEMSSGNNAEKLSGVVQMLIEMRNEARANKNWALSDEIRDRLAALEIHLKDGKEGTTFTL